MNNKWIIFSYSVPATLSSERVRFWRRVSAIGSIQLKNSLYILPNLPHLHEQVQWITKEVEDVGGEAAMFVVSEVENVPHTELQQLFTTQSNAAYAALFEEISKTNKTVADGSSEIKPLQNTVKKLRKKLESIRETDFFPSGEFNKVRVALDALADTILHPDSQTESLPKLDPREYENRTWVTREHPYIDRLASFWLISRYVDKHANLRFLAPDEEPAEGEIPFDMSTGLFSHHGPLITFEVLAICFGVSSKPIKALIELIRPIDLQEDSVLPDDAMLFKQLLDGHINIASDDFALTQIIMLLFDEFEASFEETKEAQ